MLSNLSFRDAARCILGIILVATVVKAFYAWRYYGFYTGDDVEIHEMVFATIFDWDWKAWEIRSAFYPLVFIYPAVAIFEKLGSDDTALLVYIGRLVVVAFSGLNLWLTYKIASRAFDSLPIGVLAALFLAVNKLHLSFATTVYPRTISSTFVLLAVWCLLMSSSRKHASLWAGLALGVAAAIRYSEIVFVVPGLIHLVMDKRYRDGAMLVVSSVGALFLIVAVSDVLYWGAWLASLEKMILYVFSWPDSLSKQPFYHYLTTIPSWSDWLTLGLAVTSLKWAPSRLALWAFLPIVLLSFLSHKESRYLLPAVPFVSMLAAAVFWRFASTAKGARTAVVGALLAAVFVLEVSFLRFRSSEEAVDAARYVAADARGGVVVQRWTSGGRLYVWKLPRFARLTQDQMEEREYFLESVSPAHNSFVIAEARDVARQGYEKVLEELGYAEIAFPTHDQRGFFKLYSR